ncbi:PAS domain-containing hybrid sensor histidine kinase/response regulator [Alteromonas sediminis]|uniref:histidine kinase n=1 Tax=Alteromonas sediminis TaxID=2259342 RepID=A0A3N5XYY1_9ALTE|nr:PAS domain-containing hybrid sensor histidine kinase/response regulator [Alteromonas sediminis]RPJ65880.1 PAS domain-containing hybrid sensor histidine kinase/response regulator [Alteromonas sediminis]
MDNSFNLISQTSNIFAIKWNSNHCDSIGEFSKNALTLLQLSKGGEFSINLNNESALIRKEMIDANHNSTLIVPTYEIKDNDGKVRYIKEEIVFQIDSPPVSFLTDVTQLEEEKNTSQIIQQRLELVLEGTRLGMWDWNPQTNDVTFDERWADMLGLKLSDLTQTLSDWQDRVHPDDIEGCFADITAHMEGKVDFYENLHRMKHTDGNWRYILDRGRVVEWDNNGGPIRFTGTHTDVTDLKNAELKAQDALLSRNRFFANMSHELRTPLHGILNLAEFAIEGETKEEKNNALKSILSSTQILTNIVNDILDFAKIDAGKLEIENIDFNLQELINSVEKPMLRMASDKGIQFVTDLSPNISNVLIGDPVRVSQIINNLCSNAVKFTESGKVTLKIDVLESHEGKETLQFQVIDTGIGISKKAQNALFQDFHQADKSTSRKYGGTGLGLSICAKLAELMNGKLDFKSAEHEGSTFIYQQNFIVSQLNNVDKKQKAVVDLKGASVLVAEDNKINQLIVANMLETHNAKVVLVENGKQCVEHLKQHPVDLILMDIQMPEMDGVQATKQIRKLDKGKAIPIVAMTANTMREDIEHYLSIGMNGYLMKPFDKEKLNSLLNIFNPNLLNLKSFATAISNPEVNSKEKLNAICVELKRLIPKADRVSLWLFKENYSSIKCLTCLDENDQVSNGNELKATDFPQYFDYIVSHQVLDASDARANEHTQCFNKTYFEPLNIYSLLDYIFLVNSKPAGVICCEAVNSPVTWETEDVDSLVKVVDITTLFLAKNITQ